MVDGAYLRAITINRLASHARSSGVLLLLAAQLLATASSAADDRYEELGPIGGRPTLGDNAEIFLTFDATNTQIWGWTWEDTSVGRGWAFQRNTAAFSDLQVTSPAARSAGNTMQLRVATADLDGDGASERIVAYEQLAGGVMVTGGIGLRFSPPKRYCPARRTRGSS